MFTSRTRYYCCSCNGTVTLSNGRTMGTLSSYIRTICFSQHENWFNSIFNFLHSVTVDEWIYNCFNDYQRVGNETKNHSYVWRLTGQGIRTAISTRKSQPDNVGHPADEIRADNDQRSNSGSPVLWPIVPSNSWRGSSRSADWGSIKSFQRSMNVGGEKEFMKDATIGKKHEKQGSWKAD